MANTWSRGRMSKNVNNDRYVSKHSQTYEWLSPALQPRATLLKFSRPFLPSTPSAGSCHALFSRLSFVLRIIASNCSKLGLVWFILRSGGIELIYIRGRGSEGMSRRQNFKFLNARNAVVCILVDCYHCITDSVTPRRQPKKSLFKNNLTKKKEFKRTK